MSDFSKIIEKGMGKVTKGVESVQNKILQKADIMALKQELKAKENELGELFTKYGKDCYYDSFSDDCTKEDVEEAISIKLNDIEEVRKEIDELSSTTNDSVFCTKCGKECDSEDEFCPKCGSRLKK